MTAETLATLQDDAAHGRPRLVQRLQALDVPQRAAALRAVDDWGNTLLRRAATAPHSSATIAALAALGADLDAPGQGGLRPRLAAAAFGRAGTVATLAVLGARTDLGPLSEVDWRLYLAQVMGLPGPLCVGGVAYPLEGTLAEGVFAPVAQAFAEFCALAPHVPADTAARITAALRAAPLQLLRSADEIAASVAAGEAVALPSGWAGHATVHVFDGDAAVLCQRRADGPWRVLRGKVSPFFGLRADAAASAALVGTALRCRNASPLTAPVRLGVRSLRHRLPAGHPLRAALRACTARPLRGRRCAVASAKAAVLALLLLEAHRRDPAEGLAQAARWRTTYKQFSTYLRYHALHTYMAAHGPGTAPPDWGLVAEAHHRLCACGRLDSLPGLAQILATDRRLLEAAWPPE